MVFFLGGDPTCTSSDLGRTFRVGDEISFSCSLNYRGRWAPTISWTTDNGDMVPSIDTGTANETVTHAVTVRATPDLHNKAMNARVFFAAPLNPPPGVDEASNVPDYEYRYVSDVIMVECKYCTSIITSLDSNNCNQKPNLIFTFELAISEKKCS